MDPKIKTHLIKTLVLPVLDYPPIPTHAMSKTQISKLQKIQNKALRFALNQRYPFTLNTTEQHETAKIAPINVRLHNQATKIWASLQYRQLNTYTQLYLNFFYVMSQPPYHNIPYQK